MKTVKYIVFTTIFIFGSYSAFSQKNSSPQNLGRNIFSLNILNLPNGNAHLGYERLTEDGLIGVKLSVNYSLGEITQAELLKYRRNFISGFDLNFYPTGQGRMKYFAGPSFRAGTVTEETKTYDEFAEFKGYEYNKLNYLGVFFNNGFVIQTTPKLYMGVQGAIGIGLFQTSNNVSSRFAEIDGFVALNMGYRF